MNQFLGKNTRVILMPGGSGVLGNALHDLLDKEEFFFINMSKKTPLKGENVHNYYCDLRVTNPEKVVSDIAHITPRLDFIVNAAYSHDFRSVAKLEKNIFLEEVYLDSYVPIKLSLLCAEHFWSPIDKSHNIETGRTVINISSGASLGKTQRPELASYGAAKAALNILTRYLHDELWSNYGVSAHTLTPGSFSDKDTLTQTINTIAGLIGSKESGIIDPYVDISRKI